ncbi:MAG TPA: hypothetical protein VF331_03090 [Polyangiales bacterium]
MGVVAALLFASQVSAQAALVAAGVDQGKLPPEAHLTLRPSEGLEDLASKVARVLSLRTAAVVEVGDNPPPGLLEAVPAGHVALAREAGHVRLVLGGAFGQSFEARVELADGHGDADVRSVALAIEALRDQAIEARERFERLPREPEAVASTRSPTWVAPPPTEVARPARRLAPPELAQVDTLSSAEQRPYGEGKFLEPIQPIFYMSAYSGASGQSTGPRMGIGTGAGLCAVGHCLLLTAEYPMPFGLDAGGNDIRYRYMTFTAGFYSHPVSFGRFTPAAGLSFLSRVGHFERDMGLSDTGLDTDLGVRGTLEGAYAVAKSVDLLAETGLDYALDRFRVGRGDTFYRGPRATPWLQVAVRARTF